LITPAQINGRVTQAFFHHPHGVIEVGRVEYGLEQRRADCLPDGLAEGPLGCSRLVDPFSRDGSWLAVTDKPNQEEQTEPLVNRLNSVFVEDAVRSPPGAAEPLAAGPHTVQPSFP
jgi:hypothetical protein